jgi:hypothetical protein
MKAQTSDSNVLDGKKHLGKEFVPGRRQLRPHCEHWTVNTTVVNSTSTRWIEPDNEVCAVICRNQPSCVGFGKDPVSHWCLWFDDVQPDSKNSCSLQTETEFVKRWQGPVDKNVWTAMEKLHVFDTAIVEALKLAGPQSEVTDKSFAGWWDFKGDNTTFRLELKDHFMKKVDNYTGTILDTTAIRNQYLILQEEALWMVSKQALANPVLDPPPPPGRPPAKLEPIAGFDSPLEDPPSPLKWKDFPNSQDTAWSKIHPDCPMGVPCFCDCKCRGAPPQNFVAPLPPMTTPCPQADYSRPLPNPYALSAILGTR